MKALFPGEHLFAAVLCSALAACSGASSPTAEVEHATALVNGPEFYSSMPTAPFQTKYRGQRRLEFHFVQSGVDTVLEYREEVGADGDGKFAIETLEVLSVLDDPDLFLILQDNRQGFTYRYRDFRVRDLELFNQNYSFVVVDGSTRVANTPCVQIRVQRRDNPVRYYTADIHARSGLVLRWEEREIAADRLLGRMEFETFELDADTSDMDLRDQLFPATPIDLGGDTGAQVGFEVLQPAELPAGFEVEIAESFDDDLGQTWAKLVYTDGVDRIVYMHRAQTLGDFPPDLMYLLPVGLWTAVFGDLNGYPLIVMGKVPERELLDMIASTH